ncbi:MAG: substrate-binding domain-containing protein, partial [Aquificaceae bacterium]
LSLALAPQMEARGKYWLIPEDKHERLAQGYGITKEGGKLKNSKRFYDFIGSPEARKIFVKYGFVLPGEAR